MKKKEPIIFIRNGITYTYTVHKNSAQLYDGNTVVSWEMCAWVPKEIKDGTKT